MPLGWSKLIGESAFAEEFYTETVFSHIDNINLFYVAATRAEQELHIQIPRGGKETQRIGSLVMSAIQCADDGSAAIGETRGSVVQDDAGRFFRFGTPERPLHAEHREPEPVASYPTRRIGARLRFRLARATLSAQLRHSDAQTARKRGRQAADRPAARSHAGRRSRIAKRSGKNPGTAVRGLFRSDRRIVVRRQLEHRAQRTRHRRPGRAIDPPC